MVPEIKRVLFTTDLSQSSRLAFDHAVGLAGRQGAGIVILHVMEEKAPYSDGYLKSFLGEDRWRQIEENRESEARQILSGKQREGLLIRQALSEFCESAKSELGQTALPTEEIAVAKGNVVDEILAVAEGKGCDLIVMGYHIRGKLGEAFLGSTTRRVLRRSRIPVMLVRLPEDM
jgi:nucleotide-binding universal stress UspA family protein